MKRGRDMDHLENHPPSKVALVERNNMIQGFRLVDPIAVNKSAPTDLVELATEIQKADHYVKAVTCNKLAVIAEQIRFLKQQAHKVLLEANENLKLNHVACNLVKKPGHVYHQYQRESGQCYLSLLSPDEWGTSEPPQTFKGSFKLEHDFSWTPVSSMDSKDYGLSLIDELFPNKAIGNIFLDSVESHDEINFSTS